MEREPRSSTMPSQATRWYDLFSRGARDWLRHNEKVRESVKEALPELVADSDVISNPENRVVRVPVRFLEHYRFRLREQDPSTGAGQGQGVEPGDVLRPGKDRGAGTRPGAAGSGEGGIEFVLELKVDDILDWLWDELQLPNLEPKEGRALEEEEFVREGWSKRGARSRLDRRRTLKEAVKRRAVQENAPPFRDDDLRFRQITARRRPTTHAVIMFVLDVSSSMDDEARKLAKTFFFWVLQGLRRQYSRIETVFIGHTISAWEFNEAEFFQVRGSGGTQASTGLNLSLQVLKERYDPSRYNSYLFYASDGENFPEDRQQARAVLDQLTNVMNFVGYLELAGRAGGYGPATEMSRLFHVLRDRQSRRVGSFTVANQEDIWKAIRKFFTLQAGSEAA